MSLRKLIEDAINGLDDENGLHDTLVAEAQLKIHELLQAAEITSIKDDHLDNLNIHNETLYIDTTWFACGPSNMGNYQLPMNIIDSPDPLKAAKIHGLGLKAKFHTKAYYDAARNLQSHKEQLEKINNEIAELNKE